jgi:uncharacterized protein (TIGR00369 family)
MENENKSLTFLQSQIGNYSEKSPSAVMRWLNPKIIAAEEGKIELLFTVRAEMTNPMLTTHGGILAAFIDEAIGVTVYSLGDTHHYTTINLNVDFFAASRQDSLVKAIAFIKKRGKSIIHAQCELIDDSTGKLLAIGSSNLLRTHLAIA